MDVKADCRSTYPNTHTLNTHGAVLASLVLGFSFLCFHDYQSSLKVCNTHKRCTSPVSSVICCGFSCPSHTSSGWFSIGLCSVSIVRRFSAFQTAIAVSVFGIYN